METHRQPLPWRIQVNQAMKTRLPPLFFALFAFIIGSGSHAQAETPVPVTATDQLLTSEGKEVFVEGTVHSTRINASGIHFLEFMDTNFICVTFAQQVAAFGDTPPSEAYKGKRVRVRGKIDLFRGAPQMKLLSPDQVEILNNAPPPTKAVVTPSLAARVSPAPETPKPAALPTPAVPEVEVVDGIPALDWKKFFPPAKP